MLVKLTTKTLQKMFKSAPEVPGKFYCFLASVLATRLRRVTEAHDTAEVQLPKGVEAPKDVAEFLSNAAYLSILHTYVQHSVEFSKTALNELDFIGDVIKFKKQQLREIKALLSRPMPQSPTSDGGLSDGETFFGGLGGAAAAGAAAGYADAELPPMAGDAGVTGFELPDSAGADSALFGDGMRGLELEGAADLMAPGQGPSVGASPPSR